MRKTVIITGSGSGIGLASALVFLSKGWNVVAAVRNLTKAAETELPIGQDRLMLTRVDVTENAVFAELVASVVERFGRIDVVVNNAGHGPMGPLETMAVDEVAHIFQTNAIGPLRLMQAVVPAMRAQGGGRIINVSSMGGEFTTPFAGAYHASKYALESLSDAMRFELAPDGIAVVVIQPGPVTTKLARSAVDELEGRAAGVYESRLAHLAAATRKQLESGQGFLSPEVVAETIFEAATAEHPRTRYKVGRIARILPFARRMMSDRAWDAVWRRMIPNHPRSDSPEGQEALRRQEVSVVTPPR